MSGESLPRAVTLSLVSHTNVGKTTLARTLLRRDVGEVRDQAHTTEESEVHVLIATPGCELRLWDTPGFGDSMRLLTRLRRHDNPLVWFFTQIWDRVADRPLWSSQQAALNVRREADLVLYLVSAAEDPAEAGYVVPELELLSWIGRPILVLLNQTGDAAPEVMAERLEVWRRHVARWPVVRGVLPLDAFSRCWVQESQLLARVLDLLPDEERPCMAELKDAWDRRNLGVFERSVTALARCLAGAAVDREPLPVRESEPGTLFDLDKLRFDKRRAEKQQAMEVLGERLGQALEELMATLLELHTLEGKAGGEIERQIDAFLVEGEELLSPERGAFLGSVVSGALGGLAADALAGGLTFGGGMVAGAILGALGGIGLARGFQLIKGEQRPAVGWAPVFLDRLTAQLILRYLAIAHFGRGRGALRDLATSRRWQAAVNAALRRRAEDWAAAWQKVTKERDPAAALRRLHPLLDRTLRELLADAYPESADLLGVEPPAATDSD